MKAVLLKKYNHHLPDECLYACVSQKDIHMLKEALSFESKWNSFPLSRTWQTVNGDGRTGKFLLVPWKSFRS